MTIYLGLRLFRLAVPQRQNFDDAHYNVQGKTPKKFVKAIRNIGQKIDNALFIDVVTLLELRQSCRQQKYELLEQITTSLSLYDTGILSAFQTANSHMRLVYEKFGRYMKSFIDGESLHGGAEKTSEVQTWIFIDDTECADIHRFDVKHALQNIVTNMGVQIWQATGKNCQLDIHIRTMAELLKSLETADPTVIRILERGLPLYDTGVLAQWDHLTKTGQIKPIHKVVGLDNENINHTSYLFARVATGTILLFGLASCGFGRIAPASQPELMDSLIKDSDKYHISYSGDKDKPGAVLFDPKQDNITLERGEKWAPIGDKKQLESMVKSMVDEYNGEYPGNDDGEKSTLNAVKDKDGNIIGYIFSPVTSKKVRPAGENSYSIDTVSTIEAENRTSGGGDSGSSSAGSGPGVGGN
jgi:hypothetical protein